jgi:ABC-type sugar transport system ATPase subunit
LRDLTLGVRPEDVALSATAEPDAYQAMVYASEPLGDRTIYDLRVGAQLVKVKAPAHFVVDIGSPIWFRVDMDRAHLFDSTSGERIDPDAPPRGSEAAVEMSTSSASSLQAEAES